MRALLINPWIYDFAAYDLWSKPLGILNIASHLKKTGCEIGFVDCLDRLHPALRKIEKNGFLTKSGRYGGGNYYAEEIDKPSVFKKIPRKYKRYGLPIEIFSDLIDSEPEPDVILVTSGMTYWYPSCIDAIRMLKERFPDTPLVLGGIYANLCFDHAKRYSGADHVYKGSDIQGIIRLVYRLADATPELPLPDGAPSLSGGYELYDKIDYVTMRTSSGCPFKCSYCGWYLSEKDMKREDPLYVLDKIEYFYDKYGVRDFAFYDEALLYNAEVHIEKIMKGLTGRKIKANFHTPNGLHNIFITPELAGLLKDSGFVRPRLSLETSSECRQAATGGKTTNELFLRALDNLQKAGYGLDEIGVYLLVGLPGQPVKEVAESVRFAASRNVRIHLEEYSPIPGTPDYARSGLSPEADPLLHNNSAFPLYRPDDYPKVQEVKDLAHTFNKRLAL